MPDQPADHREMTAERFAEEIVPAGRPAVFRGLVGDWPVVRAGLRSPAALVAYISRFDRGRLVPAMMGPPRINGRFFYTDDLSGFNFKRQQVRIGAALDFLLTALEEEDPATLAIQSTSVWQNLSGFEGENAMPLLDASVEPRVWIGNKVIVAAHHDPSENIACVVAGRRRFTLFPPDQIANLYMGPFERTPAGTTISMVDFDAPDLERHPGFADAMKAAIVVDLEPGDALYIPYMWWHHVRSLDGINMLVNYWWKPATAARSHPMDAMLHAMMTIRDLPEPHRAAWRAHFDYYVFGERGAASEHLPADQRGVLGALDVERLGQLREAVLKGLNR